MLEEEPISVSDWPSHQQARILLYLNGDQIHAPVSKLFKKIPNLDVEGIATVQTGIFVNKSPVWHDDLIKKNHCETRSSIKFPNGILFLWGKEKIFSVSDLKTGEINFGQKFLFKDYFLQLSPYLIDESTPKGLQIVCLKRNTDSLKFRIEFVSNEKKDNLSELEISWSVIGFQ